MSNILLSEDKILKEAGKWRDTHGDELMTFECHNILIAKAQLKAVMEWGNGECLEHPYRSRDKGEAYNRKKHRCPECWQSLLKEIE